VSDTDTNKTRKYLLYLLHCIVWLTKIDFSPQISPLFTLYSLLCMQRSNYESVPGCSGSELDQNNDYCYARPSQSHLWIVGDNGVPESAFPLHSCDGDCDSDDDCFGDLICLQRGGDEEVPGCIGNNSFTRKDFCYDPNPNQTSGPTQGPTTSAPQPTTQPISPTPPVSHDESH